MPRLRQIVSQADAALALAEDFARAARDMGDMSNYYRWRDVAKDWRRIANLNQASENAFFLPYRIVWNTGDDFPPFQLTQS